MPSPRMLFALVHVIGILCPPGAWAGPPFLTDDPEPVKFKHWEFYTAAEWTGARSSASGTLPHIEVNYGVLPNVQLHTIVPAVLAWTRREGVAYGFGDIELGVKLRFVDEGEWCPQIGIFPLVDLPTGSKRRGLGAGALQSLLPLWLQKSFGPWTTYGGGGLKLAPDPNAIVLGWLVQRDLSKKFTLGLETYITAPLNGDVVQVQMNLGTIINFSCLHHLLCSLGPSFGSDSAMQAYLAYQLTI